jgi:hypothetical protein
MENTKVKTEIFVNGLLFTVDKKEITVEELCALVNIRSKNVSIYLENNDLPEGPLRKFFVVRHRMRFSIVRNFVVGG